MVESKRVDTGIADSLSKVSIAGFCEEWIPNLQKEAGTRRLDSFTHEQKKEWEKVTDDVTHHSLPSLCLFIGKVTPSIGSIH